MPDTSPPLPAATLLKQVAEWDGKSQEIRKTLAAALDAGGYQECIKDLKAQGIDPQSYIDNLNQVGSYSSSHTSLGS